MRRPDMLSVAGILVVAYCSAATVGAIVGIGLTLTAVGLPGWAVVICVLVVTPVALMALILLTDRIVD